MRRKEKCADCTLVVIKRHEHELEERGKECDKCAHADKAAATQFHICRLRDIEDNPG